MRDKGDLLKLLRFVNSSKMCVWCYRFVESAGQVCDRCASCFINLDCLKVVLTLVLRFDPRAMPLCRYGLCSTIRSTFVGSSGCIRKAAIYHRFRGMRDRNSSSMSLPRAQALTILDSVLVLGKIHPV